MIAFGNFLVCQNRDLAQRCGFQMADRDRYAAIDFGL